MITTAIYAAAFQTAAADSSRKAFTACLREAVEQGKSDKVEAGGFDAYVRSHCISASTSFRDSMVSFDVKNKVPRKQATSEAESQISDYYSETGERYKMLTGAAGKPQ
ncbi:MAG: hypothetical protein ABI626_04855 [Sphingomicrobium sp.]